MHQSTSKKQQYEFDLYTYLVSSAKYNLEDRIRVVNMKRGEYVYKPPSQLHCMYEILEGVVKIGAYSPKGEEILYDVLTKGDFFGNLQYLNEDNFQEFSKVVAPVTLRMYAIGFYKHIIVYDPYVSEWFNKYIVSRWCKVEARMFAVCSNNTDMRILNLLKTYNLSYNKSDGTEGKVLDLLSQQDLAHLSGTTRQTVATAMRRLKKNSTLEF